MKTPLAYPGHPCLLSSSIPEGRDSMEIYGWLREEEGAMALIPREQNGTAQANVSTLLA